MSLNIEDGKGKGFRAGVSIENRLMGDVISHSGEFDATVKGNAYLITANQTDDTLGLPNAKSNLLYVRNDSATQDLSISSIFMNTNTAGVVATFQRNPATGTISASNNASAINLNFQSGLSPDITAYSWNETASGMGGFTAGSTVNVFILGVGPTVAPIDEAILLSRDDGILITTEAPSGTPEFMASIRFHMVNRDYLEDFK